MSKTIRIEGQVKIRVLMPDDCFKLEAAHALLEYPYSEADKTGKVRDRLDRLVVIRYIRNGKADAKPSVAIMRDQTWTDLHGDGKSITGELQRMKNRRGLDPTDLASYEIEIVERGVRVYESD